MMNLKVQEQKQKQTQMQACGEDVIVERFLRTYQDRSPYTMRNYRRAIQRFRRFIEPVSLNDATWRHVEDFKLSLLGKEANGKRSMAAGSVAVHMASLRSFYKWAHDPNIGLLKHNPTTCVRMPKLQPDSRRRFLTKRETVLLLGALREESHRNYVIGMSMVMLGLRVSELINIRWRDFYWDVTETTVWLSVRNGKGCKSREIKVPRTLWTEIEAMQNNKDRAASDLLFPISVRQIERIIQGAGRRSCLQKDITPHWLRHTNATLALLNGASLQQVQESLGHVEIVTTQRYLHTVEQLKKAASDYVEDGLKDTLNLLV